MKANRPIIKCGGKLVLLICAALPGAIVQAGDGNAQKAAYDKIAERNVFGLVSPSEAPINISGPAPAAAQVKLTGITTVLGQKRAFFVVHSPPESGKTKDESYMLTLGQRQGGYELLDVDEKSGAARIRAEGRLLVLTLASPKLPTATAAATTASAAAPALPAVAKAFQRNTTRPAANMPAMPPLPGVPQSESNPDSQPEADAGRP